MTRTPGPGTGAFVARHAVWLALLSIGLAWALFSIDLWTSDDAFISFRYAANLVDGKGLVFNEGERVEAYTNFLWTVWAALGLALGASAEAWTQFWGVAFFLVAIVLLAVNQLGLAREFSPMRVCVPLGALAAAMHRDWSVFATSGLETAAFTTLLLAGFLVLVWRTGSPRGAFAAGAVFALAALTRPEGVLIAGIAGLFVLLYARPRASNAFAYTIGFVPLFAAFIAWRFVYYGDIVPNTYYAKSASVAWYSQGLHYLALYLERYWALALGPVLLLVAAVVDRRRFAPSGGVVGRQAVLALAISAVYTLYVVRVGGDFMFARFLIPVTPFLLVLVDLGWLTLFRTRPVHGLAVAAVLLAGIVFTPAPVSGTRARHGIVDERAYYSEARVAKLDRKAAILRRYFEGLPVRVAFYGDEARVVYKAGFPVAIESHGGLTEPEVARQPIAKRGRIGHEKVPTAEYLIVRRGADITFSGVPQKLLRLANSIPEVIVRFDGEFTGQLLRWNPELVAAIRKRGAQVPPFMEMLDRYVATIDSLPVERVAGDYERFRRFYFDHVEDAPRQDAFRRRLGRRG